MTTIKLGPIISDARGSTGGTTFSRGPFGHYMKQRVAPTNPSSPRQASARALFSTIVNEWMTVLTTLQRDLWNEAVKTFTVPNRIGDAIHLTGMQWYMRCNVLLNLTGQALVTSPPVIPIVPAGTFTLAWTTLVGIEITAIGDWDDAAHDQIFQMKSPNLALTKNFWKGPWESTFTFPAANLAVLPELITGSASLVANSRVFYSFRTVNADGGNSFPVIYSADVGSPP